LRPAIGDTDDDEFFVEFQNIEFFFSHICFHLYSKVAGVPLSIDDLDGHAVAIGNLAGQCMRMIAEFVAVASLSIWLYLLLARGGFWRVRQSQESMGSSPQGSVAVIVPARNEAEVVGSAVRSLLNQDYAGTLQVYLVDDESTDETAEVASRAAVDCGSADRLSVLHAPLLPPGWTGKLWALSQGVAQATSSQPDYFLLTDADIVHAPDNLAKLVTRAQTGNLDLVSLMVRLRCQTLTERALIPAFVFFFFMLYPPAWVSRADRRTAAAAGGCILVRRSALERIGGIDAIRDQIIDDCALAAKVKPGGRTWLGATSTTLSARGYGGWAEIGRMISRSAFTQLRHSVLLLLGTTLAMAVTFLAPPLLLFVRSWAALAGLMAWILMTIAFLPTLHFYRRSALWGPLLPLISLFYLGTMYHSAIVYWRGRGGAWKGRIQDPMRT
jgi:hopene-associated glycosyltransferase HpnB